MLPFGRFRDAAGAGVDTVLGPEMRSTGEVMGIDDSFGTAFAKSQEAVYGSLPVKGRVFVSVANRDKRAMVFPVKRLADLGFEIWATSGTAEVLRRNGVRAKIVRKQSDGAGPANELGDREPTVVARILDGEVDLIVNTPFGAVSAASAAVRLDGYEIRTAAVRRGVPCVTTVAGLAVAVQGYLKKVGIETEIQKLEIGAFLAQIRSGKYGGIFTVGWTGDNGDPDNFLYELFGSAKIPVTNTPRYKSPEADKLLSTEEGIVQGIRKVVDTFGQIDIAVNNVGIGGARP